MVVVTLINTTSTLSSSSSSLLHLPNNTRHFYTFICRPTSPSLLYLRQLCRIKTPTKPNNCGKASSSYTGVLLVKGYMEESNSVSGFANKVIGALPLIGLFARIFSDVGGVGGDIIDFAEFRRRVGNNSSVNASRAFYEFQERRGKAGDPLYVLLCCWLAAVGAGLLKSEEILEGVVRLRLSNDIEFEEETFIALMNEAREKRTKLGVPAPTIPMEARAEKAMDAIYVCCFGRDPIDEVEESLLCIMLTAVFPSVGQPEITRIVKDKTKRVAEEGDEDKYPEPKPLSKEAVQLQMKDLQFLKQNSET